MRPGSEFGNSWQLVLSQQSLQAGVGGIADCGSERGREYWSEYLAEYVREWSNCGEWEQVYPLPEREAQIRLGEYAALETKIERVSHVLEHYATQLDSSSPCLTTG